MKKPTTQTLQHRKPVIRRETIAVLTPPQLSNVAGGSEGSLSWLQQCGGGSDPGFV